MTIKPLVAAAFTLASIALAPAAGAQRYGYGYPEPRYEQPYRDDYRQQDYARDGYYQVERGYRDDRRGYDQRGYDPRRYDGRGYDARGDRRCSNGSTGTILGALAGGLLGHGIAGRGDRAVGTVLGAGAGALAGHAVEKSSNPEYCR
ncbi:glycine zipper 2TM domain-containing protein [Sphingomonas bacterium]|uniref:glycine zipper 2TM domain-containing protein n=1 Tax=Sphingomonas bacterium TaxID=1895847 RepID=UPI00157701E5|nr:glycine zipper 2TM domain-containing protein [Sphingomonas bacterium]